MLFPAHPQESRLLLRFLETEVTLADRINVIASSLFFIGSVSWLPILTIWAYRRWKQVKCRKRKAIYGAFLVAGASLAVCGPLASPRVGNLVGIRKWKLWKSWLRYLAVEVIEDRRSNKNNPTDPAIVAMFSHGVFPFSLALASLPQIMSEKGFGLLRPVVATATRYLAPVNIILSWLDKVCVVMCVALSHFHSSQRLLSTSDASRESVDQALAEGHRIALIPGGIAEIFEGFPKPGTKRDTEYSIVRRGFLKLAVKHGLPVIPVYCFGSTKLFRRLELGSLERLSAWLKASIVVFYGICGLPVPFRQKLSYVIGRPIRPPDGVSHPEQAVDAMYDSLCQELINLFDRHKEAYGWERKSLQLISR